MWFQVVGVCSLERRMSLPYRSLLTSLPFLEWVTASIRIIPSFHVQINSFADDGGESESQQDSILKARLTEIGITQNG